MALEETRVKETETSVKVMNLNKIYRGPVVAVKDVSFGVDQGECMALLGFNGAGKSTTFKNLTGDVCPTKGSVVVGGINLQRHFKRVTQSCLIGYCP